MPGRLYHRAGGAAVVVLVGNPEDFSQELDKFDLPVVEVNLSDKQ